MKKTVTERLNQHTKILAGLLVGSSAVIALYLDGIYIPRSVFNFFSAADFCMTGVVIVDFIWCYK